MPADSEQLDGSLAAIMQDDVPHSSHSRAAAQSIPKTQAAGVGILVWLVSPTVVCAPHAHAKDAFLLSCACITDIEKALVPGLAVLRA